MLPLTGLRILQPGPGLAAAICTRLLADTGALVLGDCAAPDQLTAWLRHGRVADDGSPPDLIVAEGSPATLAARGHDPDRLRARAPLAVLVLISPFGQTGPRAEDAATDLTLMAASGIARMLTGQVDDLTEPPVRPVGAQSSFLGGIAAACAGMHAALAGGPAVIDVSIQEALATLAMTELSRAGQTGRGWSRRRQADGNGATVCILPACDGYAAISPREERQWRAWVAAMGAPAWGDDPRFDRKPDRIAHWDELHALMGAWSRKRTRQEIADLAQAAHVPSFPLREVAEQFGSAQLAARGFWRETAIGGQPLRMPGLPFGLQLRPG
jgi:crotonobetainyl-CoA:carnitine CoA-transferase CaiB-like acyl-CoA transferase